MTSGEPLGAQTSIRDVSQLGDFTATPRMITITALALPVGAVSAVVAWTLLRLIGLITNVVFYDRLDTRLVAPGVGHHNPAVLLLAPVIGGLVVGLMARFGSEKIRGHGMPEAIEAILLGGSKVQPRVAVLKPVSAAVAIGTGGPFGAEGPIIMTGGAIGSLFAQFLKMTADERKTLLVAGAAAGMAATFNTPFAALMLAVELLLFEWRPRSYVPVAAAVAVATIVRHPMLGSGPLFPVTGSLHIDLGTYALCVVSGICAGLLAIVATVLVYAAEDLFHRLPIHWMWWPAIGGLIIGVGGLIVPQALGVGYNIIGMELDGSIGLGLVVGILVVKTLIWSLSLGSGTSGGVLAPMFMIGGALGTLEAHIFPAVGPGFWALVALAGVLGGVMRSPMTGVVFALELTHRWGALLPLLIGASTAYAVSVLLLRRSVLTEKIARRGYHLSREYDVDPMEILFVGEVMVEGPLTFTGDVPAGDALAQVSGTDPQTVLYRRQMLYPVVDQAGCMTGVVTRTQLESAANEKRDDVAVGELALTDVVVADPDEILRVVVARMAEHAVDRMPVVDRHDRRRIVGFITVTMLLAARVRDLEEASHSERVLKVPRRLAASRHARPDGDDR
ncbi:chloride channel protein [Rudaeicoccus suwonensis]|uniref:H+/Cl-antiporter ClcA n=1 Tax=Rudaeicoccus suwonensis TaxID=657409 RepID=A0A561E6W2_9MICO|nr:chloride channel protein [Rudaeicoccus suwonensis]TWE11356.1 H+/Cl- antiporter ClcA [Rudaeicoccus suwonensis]